MIEINKCNIADGKLIIEANVRAEDYYKDVYIDSLIIDTEETFSSAGPSSKPIFKAVFTEEVEIPTTEAHNSAIEEGAEEGTSTFNINFSEVMGITKDPYLSKNSSEGTIEESPAETEEPEVQTEIRGVKKSISIELTPMMLGLDNLSNNMFFVYVTAIGTPSANTPCGKDNVYTKAIAVDFNPIYKTFMGYIRQLDDTCKAPKGFIDMILKVKAFELALKTGNDKLATEYWIKMFKDKIISIQTKSCGCNGIY